MTRQDHPVEAEHVEQRENVGRDILLGPTVRRRPRPAVAGQVRCDDAHPGRWVRQEIPVLPMVLRETVQDDDASPVHGPGFGDVKPHAVGVDEGPPYPGDRRWVSGHD